MLGVCLNEKELTLKLKAFLIPFQLVCSFDVVVLTGWSAAIRANATPRSASLSMRDFSGSVGMKKHASIPNPVVIIPVRKGLVRGQLESAAASRTLDQKDLPPFRDAANVGDR